MDFDDKMKEISICFNFKPKSSNAARKVAAVHTHLLSKMKGAFTDDFIMLNNKGNMVKTLTLSTGAQLCTRVISTFMPLKDKKITRISTLSSTIFISTPLSPYLPFRTTTH
jgi:hypothetical protein